MGRLDKNPHYPKNIQLLLSEYDLVKEAQLWMNVF